MSQRAKSRRPQPAIRDDDLPPAPRRGRSVLGWCASAAAHAIVFAALFELAASMPVPQPPSAIPVNLVQVQEPQPQAPPGPPGPAGAPAEAKTNGGTPQPAPQPVPRPAAHARSRPAPAPVETAAAQPVDDYSDMLSDAELAGAASADEGAGSAGGGGGGGCDTARALQQALRKDPLVLGAVEDAHRLGKSVMLWNGDWVRAGTQDGKGLSAVREAIIWELAFAPQSCRNKQMHGLVLLSLSDGRTRFAIGAGAWRWSDLLQLRGG